MTQFQLLVAAFVATFTLSALAPSQVQAQTPTTPNANLPQPAGWPDVSRGEQWAVSYIYLKVFGEQYLKSLNSDVDGVVDKERAKSGHYFDDDDLKQKLGTAFGDNAIKVVVKSLGDEVPSLPFVDQFFTSKNCKDDPDLYNPEAGNKATCEAVAVVFLQEFDRIVGNLADDQFADNLQDLKAIAVQYDSKARAVMALLLVFRAQSSLQDGQRTWSTLTGAGNPFTASGAVLKTDDSIISGDFKASGNDVVVTDPAGNSHTIPKNEIVTIRLAFDGDLDAARKYLENRRDGNGADDSRDGSRSDRDRGRGDRDRGRGRGDRDSGRDSRRDRRDRRGRGDRDRNSHRDFGNGDQNYGDDNRLHLTMTTYYLYVPLQDGLSAAHVFGGDLMVSYRLHRAFAVGAGICGTNLYKGAQADNHNHGLGNQNNPCLVVGMELTPRVSKRVDFLVSAKAAIGGAANMQMVGVGARMHLGEHLELTLALQGVHFLHDPIGEERFSMKPNPRPEGFGLGPVVGVGGSFWGPGSRY